MPQRSPEHGDAPVLSNECDMRWVQCEHCHFWHHWVCAMYDDTQYKKGRPYYCQKCAATYEPVTLTLTRTLTLALTRSTHCHNDLGLATANSLAAVAVS